MKLSPKKMLVVHHRFKNAAQFLLVTAFMAAFLTTQFTGQFTALAENAPANLIPIEQVKQNLVNQGVGKIETSNLVQEGKEWFYYFNVRQPDQTVQQVRMKATAAASDSATPSDRAPAREIHDFSRR